MRRFAIAIVTCVFATGLILGAQQAAKPAPSKPAASFTLSIDNIMKGPKLIGTAPSGIRFSPDSSKIYFSWQKPSEDRANTYVVNRDGADLKQLTAEEARAVVGSPSGRLDRTRKRLLASEGGNVVIYDVATGNRRLLMKTAASESNPRWVRNDTAITFMRDGNLFLLSLDASAAGPTEVQLTDVVASSDAGTPNPMAAAAGGRGSVGGGAAAATGRGGAQGAQGGQGGRGAAASDAGLTDSQRFLRDQERGLIDYIKRQAEARQQGRGGAQGGRGGRGGPGGAAGGPAETVARFTPSARQTVTGMALSGDENFVYIVVSERPEGSARNQDVPAYVTESSYTEMINGRTNVGDVQGRQLLAVLDLKQNRTVWADASAFAGSERQAKADDKPVPRILNWGLPECSDDLSRCVASVRSQDYKDRWLVTIDPATGKATVIDAVHDNAWIRESGVALATGGGGGFGGGGSVTWLPDNKRILFMAEKDGWMHIYSLDVTATPPTAKALTTGKWEVASAQLSLDRTRLYFSSSEVHPGERHFYTMSVDGGAATKITTLTGQSDVTVSPDEKSLAVLYSVGNRPAELYTMPFTAGGTAKQVTTTPTPEFLAFKWIEPKIITYKARDGALVYARLYTPEMVGAKRDPNHPGVVFVHGAGYLQLVTKAWPQSYYREHMFHHILASKGYVVISPDYRASAGYGRDWRTAIYEHMGGKDLDDSVDAAKYLSSAEQVNPKRIGIYGGSYGGFLTLMAMFTTPDVFAAGAALRPVTDWAHYNHGYTAQILNTPQVDPEAYKRSSPIYFAEGLKGQLLICHGMVDTNVFFQDTVRLMQRLIELGKETWSVAPYPVENHSFTEETSWADEYKRIYKLFEQNLRK